MRAVLLSDRVTDVLVDTTLERVTVQVLVAAEPSVVGEQTRELGVTGAITVRTCATEALFKVAVTVAEVSTVRFAAVAAENEAELCPLDTVTDAGTVTAEVLLEDRATAVAEVTALDNVTVQVEAAPALTDAGEQVRVLGVVVTGASRLIEAVRDTPFSVAVTVAVAAAVKMPVVAENATEDCPLATVADAGTVSAAALSEIVIAVLAVATAESVAVQVAVAEEPSEVGEQTSELNVGAADSIVTVPPVDVMGNVSALLLAALTLDAWMFRVTVVELARTVTLTLASTPLAIVLLSKPQTTQFAWEVEILQESDFPTAVAAAPADTLTEPSSAALYIRVNSTAAGWDVVEELVRESANATVEPGSPDPEESVKLVVWLYASEDEPKKQRLVKSIERREKFIIIRRPVRPDTQNITYGGAKACKIKL